VLGDGKNTFFWFERWFEDVPFCRQFARLFDLATNKLSTVAHICALGCEEGGEAWSWRRRLWVWEDEMIEGCRRLLDGVIEQSDISDRWQCDSDIPGGYTVRGASQVLTTPISSTVDAMGDLVSHKQVPLKVSIFAWRLLKDRLPTKINLQWRGFLCVEVRH